MCLESGGVENEAIAPESITIGGDDGRLRLFQTGERIAAGPQVTDEFIENGFNGLTGNQLSLDTNFPPEVDTGDTSSGGINPGPRVVIQVIQSGLTNRDTGLPDLPPGAYVGTPIIDDNGFPAISNLFRLDGIGQVGNFLDGNSSRTGGLQFQIFSEVVGGPIFAAENVLADPAEIVFTISNEVVGDIPSNTVNFDVNPTVRNQILEPYNPDPSFRSVFIGADDFENADVQFAPRDNAGVGPGVDITPTRNRRTLVGLREGTPTLELRLLPDDLPVPPALVAHQGGEEVIILITESNFSQLPVGVYLSLIHI